MVAARWRSLPVPVPGQGSGARMEWYLTVIFGLALQRDGTVRSCPCKFKGLAAIVPYLLRGTLRRLPSRWRTFSKLSRLSVAVRRLIRGLALRFPLDPWV